MDKTTTSGWTGWRMSLFPCQRLDARVERVRGPGALSQNLQPSRGVCDAAPEI